MTDADRKLRRGFRGGGAGVGFVASMRIGGSACLVCSYRSPIKLVSSLNEEMRVVCFGLKRTLLDLSRAITYKA